MTKQVHIHIHRTKARDAGEGEGKWITLSPSGTHVKIDKGGEITAGPKGMTGKKPSELSKGASGSPKPIKHATGQGQSFLPTQPKMGHGTVTKTGSGFTAKNHKGFKEYFKPHEEEKARAYAASGKEDVPTRAQERTPMRQEMRNLQAAGLKEARKLTRSPAQPGMERSINRLQAEADIKEAKERVYARRSESRSKDPDTGFVVHKNTRFDPKTPPLKGSAGPATTKTDWSKSNGDWTTAKKEGAAMFERAMSSAKTGGDRTDAALKLKAEAAEQQKNGSYLGAVVLGLVNDYFDRLK